MKIRNKELSIRDGYRCREEPDYYSDNPDRHSEGVVWQPEVYEIARMIAQKEGCDTVVDVGCGSATKLTAIFSGYRIIGIDYGENLDYCRKNYLHGEWLEVDFESVERLPVSSAVLENSVLVCADVIEHLINPVPVLNSIKDAMAFCKYALISTPDRNLVRGRLHNGPPDNPHHVREWTLYELRDFIQSLGMNIVYAGLTVTNNMSDERNTILIVIEGRDAAGIDDLLPPKVPGWEYLWRVEKLTLQFFKGKLRKVISKMRG